MIGSTTNPILLNTVYVDSEYSVGEVDTARFKSFFIVIKNLGWDGVAQTPTENIVHGCDTLEKARVYIANQYSEKHR